MKSKLLLLSLFVSLLSHGQKLPITGLCLSDVLAKTGGTCLSSAFANANSTYFDANYAVSGNCLNDFRNYGSKACQRPNISGYKMLIYRTTCSGETERYLTQSFLEASMGAWEISHNSSCVPTGYNACQSLNYAVNDTVYWNQSGPDCSYVSDGYYLIIDWKPQYMWPADWSGGFDWPQNVYHIANGKIVSIDQANPIITATVGTGSLLGRTHNTIHSGGIISADGGAAVTARGICYSSTEYLPSLTNSSHTSDGTGTGIYDSYATNLIPNTLYNWRAYATNSAGTSYGTVVSDYTLCSLSWTFASGGTGDFIHITINGAQVVSTTSTQSGTLSCALGDTVTVTVNSGNRDWAEVSMAIDGGSPVTDIQYAPNEAFLSGSVNGNVVVTASSHN